MTKINIFDRTLKIIARNYADLLLRLAFPDVPVRLVGTLENVELSLPVRAVDFVHRVEYETQEYILHLEFQLEHQAGFPQRMCGYYGALTEQFEQPVMTLALYLKPRRSAIPNEYVVTLGEQVVNRFTYPVIPLWDYVEEIRSGQYRELAPLLTMLVREPGPDLLREERELIRREPDEQRRADLLALAVTIATRYFDKAFLWRFFREELEQMREATFVEEWIQEGVEQGHQQGRQQGLQENILQVLRARFGLSRQREEPLANQLETIDDLDALRDLFNHALLDITLTDFSTQLERAADGRQLRSATLSGSSPALR